MSVTTPTIGQPAAPGAAAPTIDFETTKEIGYYRLVWRRFCSRRVALVATIILGVLVVACYLGPLLLPGDCGDLSQISLAPFSTGHTPGTFCVDAPNNFLAAGNHFHLLGTDDNGRDLLVRNLNGGRISLLVGASAMTLTIFIATILGALAGFFGGLVDTMVSALTNAILSIPSILVLIIFVKTFNSTGNAGPIAAVGLVVLGIAIISWPYTARIIRSVILSVREKEFVEAARAVGTSRPRIIVRHLIPNALGPIVVSASLTIGAAILTESALSFLGYGVNPPTPTWGNLLNEGRDHLNDPNGVGFFYALWPGFLILTVVLCFNYIGDALRDAFDPRSLER